MSAARPEPVLSAGTKQLILSDYLDRFPRDVVIETGIYNGHGSTFHLVDRADVYAIERDHASCDLARNLHPGVIVWNDDSATFLADILGMLDRPALFWLDAHCMVEYDTLDSSPLSFELQAILEWPHCRDSVVLIDDLRLMGRPGWPTLEELREWLAVPWWTYTELDDVLRLTPRSEPRRSMGA